MSAGPSPPGSPQAPPPRVSEATVAELLRLTGTGRAAGTGTLWLYRCMGTGTYTGTGMGTGTRSAVQGSSADAKWVTWHRARGRRARGVLLHAGPAPPGPTQQVKCSGNVHQRECASERSRPTVTRKHDCPCRGSESRRGRARGTRASAGLGPASLHLRPTSTPGLYQRRPLLPILTAVFSVRRQN